MCKFDHTVIYFIQYMVGSFVKYMSLDQFLVKWNDLLIIFEVDLQK